MNLELNGRIALVTGGSKGIGAGIVRCLAEEGMRVAVCARPSTAMEALMAELQSAGFEVMAVPANVMDPEQVREAVALVVSRWGGLDLLVNNVGGAVRYGGFEELGDEDWMRAFEFNVMPVVRFVRAVLPHLRRSTLRRIINVSSISAIQPGLFNPHYALTKSAVVNLGKQLANAFAKDGILVNTVCPGPVRSEAWEANIRAEAERTGKPVDVARELFEEREALKVPLGRVGQPADVAGAVAFLASQFSSWTSGSCLHINGGKLAAAI